MLFKPVLSKNTKLQPDQQIAVVYASAYSQKIVYIDFTPKMRVIDAIRLSGLLAEFPEINIRHNQVGIFGRKVSLELPVKAGDRVEIYRPLKYLPQDIRRRRALQKH